MTVPERHETLVAQQRQLVAGTRDAQMFPHGTQELPLPKGMIRTPAASGVFHHNHKIAPAHIKHLAATGRENEILGLGPLSKEDVATRVRHGETPVAVVERQRDGTEVRAAAGTDKTAAHQMAAMEDGKSPGNRMGVEDPGAVIADRARSAIYIVRHGATKLNNQTDTSVDRIRGWSDVPLVESGREDARKAALKLKSKGVQAIVASDLSRAHETAEIIGKILGVKPVASKGLRPWNLGKFTGVTTEEALPQIADYVRNKPDQAVPEGESFNQFKDRAFEGLADAIEANQGKVLVIVTHHRNERLYEAWEKAGRPEDLSINLPTFLSKGDPPGGIKELKIGGGEWTAPGSETESSSSESRTAPSTPTGATSPPIPAASGAGSNGPSMPNPSDVTAAPDQPAEKLSHAEAHYGLSKPNGDRCAGCKAFHGKDDCDKVVPPIAPAGWCRVGVSKADGHPYYEEAESEEVGEAPQEPQPKAAMMAHNMAHGRAIAGAKALHAVGHITEKQRDKHVMASQKAIGKPRKAFGSWAP